MPMGTPETSEDAVSVPVDPYKDFKFDPMTGKPLSTDTESAVAEPDENAFTHYVHLADGRVIKALGSFTHYFESDDPNATPVHVIGVYPR